MSPFASNRGHMVRSGLSCAGPGWTLMSSWVLSSSGCSAILWIWELGDFPPAEPEALQGVGDVWGEPCSLPALGPGWQCLWLGRGVPGRVSRYWEEDSMGECPEIGKRSQWLSVQVLGRGVTGSVSRYWHPKLMRCESCVGSVQSCSSPNPVLAGTGIPEGYGSWRTGGWPGTVTVVGHSPFPSSSCSAHPVPSTGSQFVPSHHHSARVPGQHHPCKAGSARCPLSRNRHLGTPFCPLQDG